MFFDQDRHDQPLDKEQLDELLKAWEEDLFGERRQEPELECDNQAA